MGIRRWRVALLGLLFAIAAAATACAAPSTERVQIVDLAGNPVQGAKVSAVTLSMNGDAKTTDVQGQASIPRNFGLQETKWLAVSKPGFQSQQIDVSGKWPLKIVLQPKPNRANATTDPNNPFGSE